MDSKYKQTELISKLLGLATLALLMNAQDSVRAQVSEPPPSAAAEQSGKGATKVIEGSTRAIEATVSGGEAPVGCLGCIVSLTGRIWKIYPESDMNRLHITTHDKIIGINGHKFHARQFQKEMIGEPNTEVSLTIEHQKSVMEVTVLRIDSRTLERHAHYYRKLASKTKYW